jgi:hypothetical protein
MLLPIIAVVCLLLLLALAYYWVRKTKVLAPFQVRHLTVPAAELTYVAFVGDYHQMMPVVNAIKDDLDRFAPDDADDYVVFGAYYDNPNNLQDKCKARAIIGIVDAPQGFAAAASNTRTYHTARHGDMRAIGADFPLTGLLSLLSAIIRGYRAIKRFGQKEGLWQDGPECSADCGYSLELYDWKRQSFIICFPLGEESKVLWGLSGAPQPAYKRPIPAKKNL